MPQGLMKTSLELVPQPTDVRPEHENEVFVRLAFYSPDSETLDDPALAFTMPVPDMLDLLAEIVQDVKLVVENDIRKTRAELPPPGTIGLN